MRVPRLRFTIRKMMVAVAVVAVLIVTGRAVLGHLGYLGRRNGAYYGSYRYLGEDWKWHEVRGTVIFVTDRFIFVD